MSWKNWPYWLKGGLIGIGVWLFLFIVDSICARLVDYYLITNIISFPGLQIYVKFIQPNLVNFEDWIIIIPSILFYFLVGALISWIYGKIKEKKK